MNANREFVREAFQCLEAWGVVFTAHFKILFGSNFNFGTRMLLYYGASLGEKKRLPGLSAGTLPCGYGFFCFFELLCNF